MMTKEQYEANEESMIELQKAIGKLAQLYVDNFYSNRTEITSISFGYDMVEEVHYEGHIVIEIETSHCSCCNPDGEMICIPIDYLWDEEWIVRAEKQREAEFERELQLRRETEEREKDRIKEIRRSQYEQLKKEFDDVE